MALQPFVVDGETVAHYVPNDPLRRRVPVIGKVNWGAIANENLLVTVNQVNGLAREVARVRFEVDAVRKEAADTGHPYDFAVFIPGSPAPGLTVLRSVLPPLRYVEVAAGRSGAISAAVAPARTISLEVRVNGERVGDASLSAGQVQGHVTFDRAVWFGPLDVLVVTGLAERDESLEDLALVIGGNGHYAADLPVDPDGCVPCP
jgi:hypothetical protein